MTDGQQHLAIAALGGRPTGLGGRWRREAGHGLHQLVDVAVVEGLAIGGLDAFDMVVAAAVAAHIPILDQYLIRCTHHIDAQVVAGLAEPQVALFGVAEGERIQIAFGRVVVIEHILSIALGKGVAVIAGAADEQIVAFATGEHVVAAIADQDVVQCIAGGVQVLVGQLDGGIGGHGIGPIDVGGLAQALQRDEAAHVAAQAAPGVGDIEADDLAAGGRTGHAGDGDGVVAVLLVVFMQVPQLAGAHADDDALAVLDALGDRLEIDLLIDGGGKTEVLQQGLPVVLRGGAAHVSRFGCGIPASSVPSNAAFGIIESRDPACR